MSEFSSNKNKKTHHYKPFRSFHRRIEIRIRQMHNFAVGIRIFGIHRSPKHLVGQCHELRERRLGFFGFGDFMFGLFLLVIESVLLLFREKKGNGTSTDGILGTGGGGGGTIESDTFAKTETDGGGGIITPFIKV
jgi:hypothetical protein